MKFTVYKADDLYLLVPDCIKASREAEHLYGPLTYCSKIESDDHPIPELWATVMAEVDARLFAVISELTANRLLGIDSTKSATKYPVNAPAQRRLAG
jgi:hypothetical protein